MPSRITAFLRSDAGPGSLVFLAAFAAYLATLATSIGFIDAGELAAVAHTLGIAHPTGYPLFTLLAAAFAKLPLGGTVIWKLNLLAAILCAGAAWAFYALFLALLRAARPASAAPESRTLPVAAATGALALAFSRTFWTQAVAVEVYSLHLLLVALVLLAFLRALPEGAFTAGPRRNPGPRRARWFLFAFVLGLGFTNHMTTVLLVPALLFGYFAAHVLGRAAWKTAGLAAPFFVLGLTPYLYLPLRAAARPAMNWGAIVDVRSFLWHVSGRQYAGWMFSSLESAGRQFRVFLSTWPEGFGYLPLALAALGLAALLRGSRRLLAFSLLLFAGCLAYAVNYDISDVVNYFLLAHVVTALWTAFGAAALLGARSRGARVAAWALCAACAALPLALNAREANERGNFAVEDYARNLLEPLPPRAVVLSSQWDLFVAGAWYLQTVEGVRPDVAVIDYELLRRSWYLRHLRDRYPRRLDACRRQVDAFLAAVEPFESGRPYDASALQAAFVAMVDALLEAALAEGAAYVTREHAGGNTAAFLRQPEGGLFRLYRGDPPPFVARGLPFRPFPKDNEYFALLRREYAYAFLNQGIFLGLSGDLDACGRFFAKARALAPGLPDVAGCSSGAVLRRR